MLLAAVIVAVFALGIPVWDHFENKKLRAMQATNERVRYYVRVMAVLWIASFAVMGIMPWSELWNAQFISAVSPQTATPGEVNTVLALMLLIIAAPVVAGLVSQGVRQKLAKALDGFAYLLPRNRREIWIFVAVSITAGICEEILYRAFLTHCFNDGIFGLPVKTALIASSVLFGLAHAGQGIKGTIMTGVLGYVFGMFYLQTGNLMWPIILHALFDLRATALAAMRQPEAEAVQAA